jgi:hypothetical protein
MARHVYSQFTDKDGNFVEQFQTTGFDARTWELALFAYLLEAGFSLDDTSVRPDFLCEKGGARVAIEATTANPSGGKATPPTLEGLQRAGEQTKEQILWRVQHEIPIRLGSPLFSKLKRRYWELPFVGETPLVFAIESFAAEDALYFSDAGLASYLYGSWAVPWRTAGGELVVENVPIQEHRVGKKVIPSGFFSQPDTENVSAVLFSNSGTFPKFGRMGAQAGLDTAGITMIRVGTCYNQDPSASEPLAFSYNVAERPEEWGMAETWGEGMSMYHNPNALHPVADQLFPEIAHHHCEDGRLIATTIPPFHPFMSQTRVMLAVEKLG